LKRRMVTVMLAGLLAVLGIVAVLAYVAKANQRAINGLKAEYVLVAKEAIPSGTVASQALRDGLLAREQVPASSVPADAVQSIATDISSLVTSSPIQPGQLLLREMLVQRSQRTGELVIPSGKVAVTVQVCLSADVGGYVKPGNYVAVFDTYITGSNNQSLEVSCDATHQAPSRTAVFTQMVLPRVQVLSVTPAPVPQASTSGTGSVLASGTAAAAQGAVFVTLAATPHEAKLLVLLNATGVPAFALTTSNSGVTADLQPAQFK
jgi:pilus assembly protein CpaB